MKPINRTVLTAAGLVALLLFATGSAFADSNHYINTFVGDRAAGMAGAYTAIADGPEGAYYNPAGLAFAGSAYISLSTNAFQLKRTTYHDVVPGFDYTQTSSSFIPNFFGFVQKYPNMTFGFTIIRPDSESVEQRETALFDLAIDIDNDGVLDIDGQTKRVNVDSTTNTTLSGPTVAWMVGDKAAVGASVFASYRREKSTSVNADQLTLGNAVYSSDTSMEVSYARSDTFGVYPQLGVQYMPNDQLSIGLSTSSNVAIHESVGTQYLVIDPLGIYNQSATFDIPPYTTASRTIFADGLFASSYLKTAVGVAWFASRSLLFSADAYTYIPFGGSDGAVDQVFTWNAATGVEWYLTPNFPFRFGLFTNNANTPQVKSGKTGQPTHTDLYGATTAVGFASAEFSLNIGGSFSYGTGEGQVLSGSQEVQDVEISAMTIFVSGGYQF